MQQNEGARDAHDAQVTNFAVKESPASGALPATLHVATPDFGVDHLARNEHHTTTDYNQTHSYEGRATEDLPVGGSDAEHAIAASRFVEHLASNTSHDEECREEEEERDVSDVSLPRTPPPVLSPPPVTPQQQQEEEPHSVAQGDNAQECEKDVSQNAQTGLDPNLVEELLLNVDVNRISELLAGGAGGGGGAISGDKAYDDAYHRTPNAVSARVEYLDNLCAQYEPLSPIETRNTRAAMTVTSDRVSDSQYRIDGSPHFGGDAHSVAYDPLQVYCRQRGDDSVSQGDRSDEHKQKHARQVRIKVTRKRRYVYSADSGDENGDSDGKRRGNAGQHASENRRKRHAEILNAMDEHFAFKNTRLLHAVLEQSVVERGEADLGAFFGRLKDKVRAVQDLQSVRGDALEVALACVRQLDSTADAIARGLAPRQAQGQAATVTPQFRYADLFKGDTELFPKSDAAKTRRRTRESQVEQARALDNNENDEEEDEEDDLSSPLLSDSSLQQPFYLKEGEKNEQGLKVRIKSVRRVAVARVVRLEPARIKLNIEMFRKMRKLDTESDAYCIPGTADNDSGESTNPCPIRVRIQTVAQM